MSDAWQVQKAIFTALSGNSTLMTAIGSRLKDRPSQDYALPYVHIGEIIVLDWGSKTFVGGDHRIMIHVWSKSPGKKEAWDIIDMIRTALHQQDLALTGHTLVLMRHESSRVFMDEDGVTIHGVTEFRAITQAT